MHVRSFRVLTFALPSLAALALPPAVHAASAVHGRRVRAPADCAAALRIALPDAHITAARAVPSNDSLRALLRETVHALQQEIPGLGESVAIDVKHIYAWVQENNPKAYVSNRYDPDRQPRGDRDCRLGVKRSTNQERPDGTMKVRKEYVWGYGTGVAAATDPRYGDVVLADYTQPFNETDPTYYRPLYQRTVETLGFRPKNIAADAAFDAWYVERDAAEVGGMAAVPLNTRGHPQPQLGPNGIHLCPKGWEMLGLYEFDQSDGYRAQELRCPLMISAADKEGHEQPVTIKRPMRTAAERAARLDGFYGTINAWLQSQGLEAELDAEVDHMIAVGDVPADVVRTAWAAAALTPLGDTVSAVSDDMP